MENNEEEEKQWMKMADPLRRPEQISPKSSPRDRGSRSPAYVPRQDSTGTLKTTISLGKVPSVIHTGPFYLLKDVPGMIFDFVIIIIIMLVILHLHNTVRLGNEHKNHGAQQGQFKITFSGLFRINITISHPPKKKKNPKKQ